MIITTGAFMDSAAQGAKAESQMGCQDSISTISPSEEENQHALSFICFPGDSEVKVSAWNAGDPGSIPGSGRSPGEGNGNPLQYSCLENPMEGGAWQATVHGVAELDMTERLHFHFQFYLNITVCMVAQMVKHLPTMRETRVQSLGWEDLLEKEMATHSSILA